MVPVRKLKWKDEDAALLGSRQDLQREFLQATVKHPVCERCPPALSYLNYFMKMLIQKLESEDADICDEMYEAYTNILTRKEDEEDSLCFKTYKLPNGEFASLQESVNLVSQGTTGLCTWQAAQHLAEWIIENPKVFNGRSVVELGSGLGLTGITCCMLCHPQSYTFTDCHSDVLSLLAKNVQHNLGSYLESETNSATNTNCKHQSEEEIHFDSVELDVDTSVWDIDASQRYACLKQDQRVRLCHLDWECVKSKLLQKLQSEIILAADVVYDTSIIPALVYVLKKLLHNKGSSAFIASTIRNEDTRDAFLIALGQESLNYSVIESPRNRIFHYDNTVPIEILQIQQS